MSSTYSGNSANFPTSITIPSDGDGPIQASDVNPAFQGNADCCAYLKLNCIDGNHGGTWTPTGAPITLGGTQGIVNNAPLSQNGTMSITGACSVTGGGASLTMMATKRVQLATRSLRRVCGSPRCFSNVLLNSNGSPNTAFYGSQWYVSGTGVQQKDTGNPTCIFDLDVPDGATITQVDVALLGTAHANFTNVNLPQITVFKMQIGSSTTTTIATATDPSSTAVYQTVHTFSATGLTEVVDRSQYRYGVLFLGETGSLATPGLQLFECAVTFSTSSYDDGAG